jgi:hypothetical protein
MIIAKFYKFYKPNRDFPSRLFAINEIFFRRQTFPSQNTTTQTNKNKANEAASFNLNQQTETKSKLPVLPSSMSETVPPQVASPSGEAAAAETSDAKRPRVDRIEIALPDDWHMHFRDDERLPIVANLSSKQFGRAIAMPNLIPPVVNTQQALAYR